MLFRPHCDISVCVCVCVCVCGNVWVCVVRVYLQHSVLACVCVCLPAVAACDDACAWLELDELERIPRGGDDGAPLA